MFKTIRLHPSLVLLLAPFLGCGGHSSSRKAATTPAATPAPVASSTPTAPVVSSTPAAPVVSSTRPAPPPGPMWEVVYSGGVTGDELAAIHPLANKELLLAQSSGSIVRLDALGLFTLEYSSPKLSTSQVAWSEGAAYLGTVAAAGVASEVLVRDANGAWSTSTTHLRGASVVLPLSVSGGRAEDLYAVHNPDPRGAGSISWRPSRVAAAPAGTRQGTWATSSIRMGRGVRFFAGAAFLGDAWLGGGGGLGGGARLYRVNARQGTPLTQVTLPAPPAGSVEFVTDLLVVDDGGVDYLYVAYKILAGNPSLVVGGGVLVTSDGVVFRELVTHTNDAPNRLAWHNNALFLGMLGGGLESRDASGAFVPDPTIFPNAGVTSLLSVDGGAALLVGVRGLAQAELYRRR